jgi:glycosyltransferase involved in cell wall biosynthesis
MRCPSLFELPSAPDGCTGWPWTAEGARVADSMEDGTPWPLISIVTPSYNQGEYLEATIRSILLQGYPNLEYIIMDGGSTDGSLAIIRKYEPWLAYWEFGPDGGQYAAVQKGFERSSGQIMAWLNSDDMYFPWALRMAGELFAALPEVRWLSTGMPCQMITENSVLTFQQISGYSRRAFFSQNFNRRTSFIQQEGCFWRKNLWEEVDAHLDIALDSAGDFELWSRFWRKADLYTVNAPLGIFRYHAGQKTTSLDLYMQEARTVLYRYHRPFPFPQILLCFMAYGLKRIRGDTNWFGVGARRLFYSKIEQNWASEISFRTF